MKSTPITHWMKLAGLAMAPQLALAAAPIENELDKLMSMSLLELINTPVVTASRQSETRDQTPSHIVVVTREQIRERRYKNLADLLEDMPGVDFQRGTKSSQFNQFTVQGHVGPSKLVVMLDGVRIGHPSGGNIPVAENLALYHARQVEFLYGPAAALYGADAVAGVVNIITDRPADRQGAWVQAGAGSFGAREASFMAGYTNDALALNVGGHVQRADRAPLQDYYPDKFRKVAAAGVAAADREDYTGDIKSGSLYARMDIGKDLTLGFYRNVFQSLTSTGDPPATAFYQGNSQWMTTTDTAYGKYRFDLSSRLSGELVVDYSRMEVDPKAKYNNYYNNFTNGYSYVLGERLGLEQNFNWQVNDSHRIHAGVGYQRYYAIETASLPAPYDTNKSPQNQGYVYPNTTLPLQIHDASFENYSAYAQWQAEWTNQLSTMAGLRLDRHSDYRQTVNPRLGAVWRASGEHVFKALYGEAFRAPSPEEYLSSFGNFDGSTVGGLFRSVGFRVPNFNLEPEKAKTVSLTWDWRPRQNLNLVANLYSSQIKNLIVTLPSNNTGAIPGAILVSPETKGNAGLQTQKGLDLMAQWRFRVNPAWSGELWGSVSFVRGLINEGDGVNWDIPYVADRKLKLGTTFRYHDLVSISPQLLVVGDTSNGRKRPPTAALQLQQDCTEARMAPDRCTTDGYAVMNLHVGWHKLLDGRATLWLDVYNLFDRRYYAAHGSGSRTFWDMPQQPRSWMASLEYRF